MKLYAFTTPDIPKNTGYLKIGETNGNITKRIKDQGHTLNTRCIEVWRDSVVTDRTRIDKRVHVYLREQGFDNPKYPDTGEYTELVKCSVEELQKAFEVIKQQIYTEEKLREAVGEQFYREIRNWFYWVTENTNCTGDYALRLIVRLLLCFFFMEKELVPKELFDENWLKDNLKDEAENRFYNGILRNIFFHCLNTPLDKRNDFEHKKMFRQFSRGKEQFLKIPFLNGGIFNELSGDDFALHNKYFFQEKETVNIKALDDNLPAAGVVRILSKYQYKLSLDDLLDRVDYTKTIDPEFVGKVFESLLACIDADTNLNRRKVTGSYYTPNEIVDYMVNESLDAYLLQRASGGTCSASGKASPFDNDVQKLLDVKILDPACGSGAFPCGIMNTIMNRIDPDKNLTEFNRYHKKLEILQNVIYGVDIQPMAVQIAVLRLFLSLIQDIVPDKKKDNYGIKPLPNLETKFVCADALIGLSQEKQGRLELPIVKATVKQLQLTRNQHLVASNPAEKKRLQEFDESLRHTLSVALEEGGDLSHDAGVKLASWNPYDQTNRANFFDSYYMFGVEKFDIVIGNPPYGAAYPDGQKKYFREHYKSTKTITGKQKGSLDTFSLFIEKGFNIVKKSGVVNFIVSIAFTSSDSMSALHNLLLQNCEKIAVSNYMDRPVQIFENAHTPVSILLFTKTETPCKTLLTTKRNRRKEGEALKDIIKQLEFVNSIDYVLYGRLPRIGKKIESSILKKLFRRKNTAIGKLIQDGGLPIYYRTGGGDYFKVFTDYPTGSTQEKPIYFDEDIVCIVGAFLSSNLFWWFQNIYADGRHIKRSEIEQFCIPFSELTESVKHKIRKLYDAYLTDIERNANVRTSGEQSSYKVDSFKEYKLVYSKPLIDAIDDLVCPLYGLTAEETAFIKSYELEFRMRGE